MAKAIQPDTVEVLPDWKAMYESRDRELTELADIRRAEIARHEADIAALKQQHADNLRNQEADLKSQCESAIASALKEQWRDHILPIKQAEHQRKLDAMNAQHAAELKAMQE